MAVAALKALRRRARAPSLSAAAAASLKALSAQYLAEAPAAENYDPAAQEARRDAQKDIVVAQQQRLVLMRTLGLVDDQVFLRLQRELDHVALSVE